MVDMSRYIVNPGPKAAVSGLKAAVTTDSAIVTEVMLDVLKRGGNAADASVAGALVQAAVEPFLTNHAGLVTLLYYEAKTGLIHQLDSLGGFPPGLPPFRPVPASVSGIPPSAIIPGFMPGLNEFHRRFCTRTWKELCSPAVHWAESGHPVSSFEYGMNVRVEKFITYFPEGREYFQPNGGFPNVGETFVQKGLATTLRRVAEEGPGYMIEGAWADAFVAKANEMGWQLRREHMRETPPRWLEPTRYTHHDHTIVSLGPPQAQGLYIGVAMGVLKHMGVRDLEFGSGQYYWAMGHALRQAARHWEYAQDDTIYGVPIDEVLDDGYHAHLAKMILKSRPKVDLTEHIRLAGDGEGGSDVMSLYAGAGGKPRSGDCEFRQRAGSCEIAVADVDGNWVQMMNTLQGSGIPGMVIGGVPMSGSSATFGDLMSPMDATLVPGAKGRSIIGNTFVLKEGRPVLSMGSPGNVHCTVPQVLTYLLDFKLDPNTAIDAPRMLPMSETRGITIEDRLSPQAVVDLHRLGVRVTVASGYDFRMGSFSVIGYDPESARYAAFADPRRCAVAGGLR